jgi:thymidylate synthase
MQVFYPNDVDEALYAALSNLIKVGIETPSRNGPQLRFATPVTTVWQPEVNRTSTDKTRANNPFFSIMESLWMLAGRSEVAFPAFYAKQILEYSDDGLTMNGAYGHRWRNYFGYDQIQTIAKELQKNPTSRRCVMSMWDGRLDLVNQTSKDLPCLSGDTVLQSPEGKKTLRQLANAFSSGDITKYPVYSVDFSAENWPISLQYCTKVWSSGKKQTSKILLDNGKTIRATDNHRFFVKKRLMEGKRTLDTYQIETELKDLKVGDILCSGYFRPDPKGYIQRKKFVKGNTVFKNLVKEHRDYYEFKTGESLALDEIIHHKNGKPDDNRFKNLEKESAADHNRHHQIINNRHLAMSKEEVKARGLKHAKSMAERKTRIISVYGLTTWIALCAKKPTTQQEKLKQSFYSREQKRLSKEKAESNLLGKEIQSLQLSEISSRQKKSPTFGKIVAIQKHRVEEVFDFTVPKFHNAILDNGVVTHNCNLQVLFDAGLGRLNMTVTNRSNDLIWGAYGANVVHFSFLHEYMAALTGLPVGCYYQVSNNLHIYPEFEITSRFITKANGSWKLKYKHEPEMSIRPVTRGTEFLVYGFDSTSNGIADFDSDLQTALYDPSHTELVSFILPGFNYVIAPARLSYALYKKGDTLSAVNVLKEALEAVKDKVVSSPIRELVYLDSALNALNACQLWMQRKIK